MQSRRGSFSTRRSRNNRRNAIRTLHRSDTIGLLLLGECEVGKTCLLRRWIDDTYNEKYTSTVEDFHVKSFSYMGQSANIGIIDMTGSRDFPAMIDLYLNRVDSVMLFYDVGNESSIKELTYLYEKVKTIRDEKNDIFVSVVGTKCDKYDDNFNDEKQSPTIDRILDDLGTKCSHIVTSAKNNINVHEAFEGALNPIVPTMAPTGDNLKRLEKLMNRGEGEYVKCKINKCIVM